MYQIRDCIKGKVYMKWHMFQFLQFTGDEGKEGAESKVSTDMLLVIMEDAIRTFMSFLKADKESLCRIIRAHFKKYHEAVDPTLVKLLKRAVKRVSNNSFK